MAGERNGHSWPTALADLDLCDLPCIVHAKNQCSVVPLYPDQIRHLLNTWLPQLELMVDEEVLA